MDLFIALILAVALAVAAKRLWDQRRAVRDLADAVSERRSYLSEESSSALGPEWNRLCTSANDLARELAQLKQQRSGQVLQLEATLGSLKEAVLMVDDGDYIVLANGALQAIFPKARKIIGQRLDLVLRSSGFLSYLESVRERRAEPRREVEFVDGPDSIWVEVTGALIPPLDGGKGSWAIFVLHDITKQRKLENIRREFVANVSHELRTPLSVIKGYIETLVDAHESMAFEDRAKFLATVQRHTQRLNSLLEDLLTLSRLESENPGLRIEATDLRGLVADLAEGLKARPGAADHSLLVAIDADVGRVAVDPLKIAQVLENLIDNAFKYTPKGSTVRVSARRNGREVELCVQDNGPGIPSKDLPHIFERFYRVEKGRSRETGGTGLGLSIVKHIVQLHGGRVWVEGVPGGGAVFRFTVLEAVAKEPAPAGAATSRS